MARCVTGAARAHQGTCLGQATDRVFVESNVRETRARVDSSWSAAELRSQGGPQVQVSLVLHVCLLDPARG